jgi:hypothetical protein
MEISPPIIFSAGGSANGVSLPNCTIDVYSDNQEDGRIYHGSAVADGAGTWSFARTVAGPNVTATCTDAAGNTSEFSAPYAVGGGGGGARSGGVDCSGAVTSADALQALRYPAGLPVSQTDPCLQGA